MSVKIGMLQRGDKFTKEEKDSLIMIQKTLRTVAMTLISFYQVDHTFDRSFVIKYLTELEALLKKLITRHLTEKSVGRVEQVGDDGSDLKPLPTCLTFPLSDLWRGENCRVPGQYLCAGQELGDAGSDGAGRGRLEQLPRGRNSVTMASSGPAG